MPAQALAPTDVWSGAIRSRKRLAAGTAWACRSGQSENTRVIRTPKAAASASGAGKIAETPCQPKLSPTRALTRKGVAAPSARPIAMPREASARTWAR